VTAGTDLSDAELLRQFEDTSLPTSAFTHHQHVRVAWLFVRRHGMPAALTAFSETLRRFANAKGAHNLFHVTITWAYLLLIHERQEQCGATSWESFADVNRDLLVWKPSILDCYYNAETLWSERARRSFVMPDRLSSTLAAAGGVAGESRHSTHV
jgi:hypothetical protein